MTSLVVLALTVAAIVVLGLIGSWAILKYVQDGRLAQLLVALVVIVCAIAVVVRVLPVLVPGW